MAYAAPAKTKRDGEPDETLTMLVRFFEESEDATTDARAKAERDRDYYDNKQFTQEEYDALVARGQPPISENVIRRKIDYLCGMEKQTRQDPRAYPRTPGDEEDAQAATDAIRYVCDSNDAPGVFSEAFADRLIEGLSAVDVCVDRIAEGDADIAINLIPWDRFFYDQHSRKPDFSDAKYLGIVLWMDEQEVLARWPDAEDAIAGSYRTATLSDTYEDRPRFQIWGDMRRRRVRVCQVYWREGLDWQYAAYTRGGFLDDPQDSPYTDDKGQPCCPIIAQSAYVDRENNRYGVVRDLVDLQDEINKRRSKALHLLNVRQVIAEQGAVADVDAARAEIAKPDGFIEIAPQMRFDIQQTTDLAQGQFQLLQEAKAAFDVMGPNAAMQGKQGASASGRAIALSQQGGTVEAGGLMDAHRRWKKRVYEAVWQRVRQFWTAEKWVRVTDDERNVRFVGINRPVTLGEELQRMPQEQAMQIAQQMGLMQGDPRLEMVVKTENRIAELEVDIIVDEAPDVVTLQQEQFQALIELAKVAPALIPPDMIIEASSLRNKERILERLKGGGPNGEPAQPPPPPPELIRIQTDAQIRQAEMAQEQAQFDAKLAFDREKANAELALKRDIAAQELEQDYILKSQAQAHTQAMAAQPPEPAMPAEPAPQAPVVLTLDPAVAQMFGGIAEGMGRQADATLEGARLQAQALAAPRRVVRGGDGRAMGIEAVQ